MNRTVQLNSAKGMAFARLAIAAAVLKGEDSNAEGYVNSRWGADSLVGKVFQNGGLGTLTMQKAAVAAGSTVSGNWAQLLADTETATAEFFALVRERSLLGRIPGLRRVPLRVRMIGMSAGFTAAWVGEGKAVPVGSATFSEDTLEGLRVASLAVLTDELIQSADPTAETLIRDDLANAVAAAINTSFIDPANSGTAGVQPASVTNGAPSVAATGDGLADIRALIDIFPGDLERAVLIGSPQTFAAMHDPVVLPGLGIRGGNAIGIPAIAATSAGDTLTLIDPAGIAFGDGSIDLRVATDATIQMDTAQTNNTLTPTATTMVSLWQTNSTAIMAEARVNWQAGRPAVATLTAVAQS